MWFVCLVDLFFLIYVFPAAATLSFLSLLEQYFAALSMKISDSEYLSVPDSMGSQALEKAT